MQNEVYRVERLLSIPVLFAMVAGAALIFLEGAGKSGTFTAVVLSPFYYLGAEILARSVYLDESGFTVNKLLRSVRVDWNRVESIDTFSVGRKAFLIVQRDDGKPVVITNTLRGFAELTARIAGNVPQDKTMDGVRLLLEDVPSKYGPTLQAWFVFAVLAGIVAFKLLGYG